MSASDLPHDMSDLTPRQIAQFFFDRPLDPPMDWWDLDEEGFGPGDNPVRYVSNLTQFFYSFAELAKPYEFPQVEQGVWGLISHCSFSVDWIFQEDRPEQAFEFLTASRPMFLEYLANIEFEAENGFFMWWDVVGGELELLRKHVDEALAAKLGDAHLAVLQEILDSPDDYCHSCALHGLGHLDHPKRPEVVDRFIERLKAKGELDEWDLNWIQECRDGTVM